MVKIYATIRIVLLKDLICLIKLKLFSNKFSRKKRRKEIRCLLLARFQIRLMIRQQKVWRQFKMKIRMRRIFYHRFQETKERSKLKDKAFSPVMYPKTAFIRSIKIHIRHAIVRAHYLQSPELSWKTSGALNKKLPNGSVGSMCQEKWTKIFIDR